ncbi:SDR family oxidoreductase [Microbispora catharanthi]|uniref:SDR family oxidoreductase n=1 Tax=Microbispora catharanthi TaxID=1712871 RepID=A0A5N6B1F0_9ACTN|nr:SDR family oxidoreductase [Microbispora catharanthi]
MNLHLLGKKAVVTGGSKGIGLAIVRLLAEEGVEVVSASRTVTPELKETGAVPIVVDLSTEHGPAELIDRAIAALGGIDLLVNNVGIGDTDDIIQGARHSVLDLPDSAWERAFDLHFYSALRVTRAALPSLVITKGTVINVSSVSARLVGAGPVDYNVSKAALNALTKVFAEQFGPQGVRAITVAPGPVSTGVWTDPDGLIARLARDQGVPHQEFADGLLRSLAPATGRITTPEEVARLVAFLASPSNITGVEYSIDGGIIKQL